MHFPGTKGNGGGGGQITNLVIDLNNPINLNSNRPPGGIANAALIPGESLHSNFVHFYAHFLRNKCLLQLPIGYPTGSSNSQGVTSRNVNGGNENINGGSSEGLEKGDQQGDGSDDSSKVLSAGPGVVAEVCN